jgi:adenylate cyclase
LLSDPGHTCRDFLNEFLIRDTSGWTDNPDANCRQGLDLARRALRFADEEPSVLARSAYALGYFDKDIDPAIALIERALQLNPGCAPAWPIGGWLRLWAGQPDRAIQDFQAYQRLRGPRATEPPGIGVAYLFSGRFEEARKSLLLSLQDFPSWVPTYRFLACCYAHMGRLGEAREVVARLRALTPVVMPSATNWRNPADRELLLSGLRLAVGEDT